MAEYIAIMFSDARYPAFSESCCCSRKMHIDSEQDLLACGSSKKALPARHARRAGRARFTHSSRSVSELTFTVSQAARGWVHARRPVSGVARCRPGARRPTGRRRRPEASAPSSARPRGVFSEMPPRNRALGDGGAGQVHGQASVRLEPLASGRDATGPRGARGKSLA